MARVLIFLEEYNEVLFLETFLKKLGFDTLGWQKPLSLDRKLLGFSPQLIITQAVGKLWSGEKVLRPLREDGRRLQSHCKVIGLLRGGENLSGSEVSFFDGFTKSPVDPPALLSVIAEALKMRPEPLLEKYKSFSNYHAMRNSQGAEISTPGQPSKRAQHYDEFLKGQPPLKGKTVSADAIRKRSMARPPEKPETLKKIEETHASKKDYLVALMKFKR